MCQFCMPQLFHKALNLDHFGTGLLWIFYN